jgi:hypothetical protein
MLCRAMLCLAALRRVQQGIIDYGEAHKHITATLQTLISQVRSHGKQLGMPLPFEACTGTAFEWHGLR